MTKSPITLVQLTDQHLFSDPDGTLRGVPTLAALQATLAAARDEINACAAILATGDLVHDDPGGYRHFRREFAALGKPILCLPGNHDDVPAMRAALSGKPFQLDGTFGCGNWRVLLLDSTVAGQTGGALSEATLEQLESDLAHAADRHALVCLHHHPVPMHSRWLDTVGLANRDAFFAVLKRHRNVRGVLFGHVHQALDTVINGVRIMATPSTCAQFLPQSQDFAIDHAPPAYRRLALHADGTIQTEIAWVFSNEEERATAGP